MVSFYLSLSATPDIPCFVSSLPSSWLAETVIGLAIPTTIGLTSLTPFI